MIFTIEFQIFHFLVNVESSLISMRDRIAYFLNNLQFLMPTFFLPD